MLFSLLRHKRAANLACLLPACHAFNPIAGIALAPNRPVRCSASWRTSSGAAMASMMTSAAAGGSGGGVAGGKGGSAGIVWFKYSDLRLEDHEPLAMAHRDCSQVVHVFCLDDRWFGVTR